MADRFSHELKERQGYHNFLCLTLEPPIKDGNNMNQATVQNKWKDHCLKYFSFYECDSVI